MRVVIAEDQVLLRDGLVRLLTEGGHRVTAAVGDAVALVEAVNSTRPDLVLADVRMPPRMVDDGARAVAFLRERLPELATVVLTQQVDPGVVALLTAGHPRALGFVLKDSVMETEAFLAQVEAVGAGATVLDPAVLERSTAPAAGVLTEREAEVLARVAAGRSNAGVAADLCIAVRTVDAHLRSVFSKLGLEPGSDDNVRVLAVLTWLASQH
ncbi:DNA-binding response regulator, NarL/FixJ family, contains REC and HTH domains [Quadrisphaera granulorum]|uniref:DNA-binding NarL/FixJ family response regulator n=1 Tax=Quadrisphaera granulorum TaxID=317664 RepID=A0A316ABD5_9ACTN|nr:response regulator transcription factor [Quadrisphaera granulorum]PWJ54892.1 DNA-binding NarL/FixJ family response regulator [Quadrisphaera granulorum]SZE95838.1 DNA-binding response regulator, NarL/FixJ family, contains REC and HTH domains [Quadrisphaera granulorum]